MIKSAKYKYLLMLGIQMYTLLINHGLNKGHGSVWYSGHGDHISEPGNWTTDK